MKKKKFNRNSLCLTILLLVPFYVSAQDEAFRIADKTSPESNINVMGTGVTVDKFNGTLNANIPLQGYKGREMDLPLSISYTATGIKVDQVAGYTGLGWVLNAGGRIVRHIDGLPDDNFDTTCGGGGYEAPEPYNADFFKVDAPGLSALYRGNIGTLPVSVIGEDNVMQVTGAGNTREFVITSSDGTKYFFGQNQAREKISSITTSSNSGCPVINSSYITAWLLTKIISRNSLDEYTFEYQDFTWNSEIRNNGEGHFSPSPDPVNYPTVPFITHSSYKLGQKVVRSISHNGKKVIGLNYEAREDMDFIEGGGTALTEINYYRYQSAEAYKKIDFAYSYFGDLTPGSGPDPRDYIKKRLKLDKLTYSGHDANTDTWKTGEAYGFSYINPGQVPSLESYARDYLGLYNAQDTNENLLPYTTLKRKYNFEASLAGTLNKITYPKGGYSIFEYEQSALEGGYGHILVPQEPIDYWETLFSLELDCAYYCEFDNPRYYDIDPRYKPNVQASAFGIPNYVYNELHVTNAVTKMLDLSGETQTHTATMTTGGFGFYVIQSLPECNTPPTQDCNMDPLYACLQDTRTIFYTFNATPQNFIQGGLVWEQNTITATLPPGKYQVTLWGFAESGPNTNVFLNLNIGKVVTHTPDPVLTDTDHTYNYTDGFRIRSITDYADDTHFSNKRVYKYGNVFASDRVDNKWTELSPGGYGTTTYLSRGYANIPYLHFGKVFELQTNEAEKETNGYTVANYSNWAHGGVMTQGHYPFSYSNEAKYPVRLTNYIGERYDLMRSFEIYTKDEKLLRKELYDYETNVYDIPYIVGFEHLANKGAVTGPVSKNIFNYTIPNDEDSVIEEINEFLFDYPYTRISHKKVNDEYVNYGFFVYPLYESSSVPVIIEHSVKGTVSLMPEPIAGVFYDGSAVTRYLPKRLSASKRTGEPVEIQTEYEYDPDGNRVTTIAYTPGTITPASKETVIYGYSSLFPVATIKGLSYAELIASNASLVNDIKTFSSQEITPANQTALLGKLQQLRLAYPDHFITTSTYDPAYGITSTTDEKGATTLFEYDAFGRLEFTKKLDPVTGESFIVSQNSFNTRP